MPEAAAPPVPADRVVAPLRQQREALFDGVRSLQEAGSAILLNDSPGSAAALEAALDYLQKVFLPAASAEEFTLYIAVEGAMAAVDGTRIMRVQHQAIAAMIDDLAKVARAAGRDGEIQRYRSYLAPLLFGLYALIRTHLEAEDDVYLSLLDEHLSESQVGVIVENTNRIVEAAGKPPAG